MKKIVIWDLDGTLADIKHRVHFINGQKKDWDAFNRECANDKPIEETANIFQMYRNSLRTQYVITGRMDRGDTRQQTINWLISNDLMPDQLYMRKNGDYRSDVEVKREILEELSLTADDVEIVFEDRSRVVRFYRDAGFKVMQVDDGDF